MLEKSRQKLILVLPASISDKGDYMKIYRINYTLDLSTLFERLLRDTSVTQGRSLTLDCELSTKNGIPTIVW